MKVLIVCSGNAKTEEFNFKIHQSFIYEQIETLKNNFSVEYDVYLIQGKGILGYLKSITAFRKSVFGKKYDVIHAHYGLSGLVAVCQRSIPVVITFHGSDINLAPERILSAVAALFSKFNIFVSTKLAAKALYRGRYDVISCGVDFSKIFWIDRAEARKQLGLDQDKKYVLFSSSFTNAIKNYPLAKAAIAIHGECELLELKGYSRDKVNLLMNAVDVVLVTSFHESGPLVVKEAITCGCPVVSTDVGDVSDIFGSNASCFLTSYDEKDVAKKIGLALQCERKHINAGYHSNFDNNNIAKKIYAIYLNNIKDNTL